MKLLCISAHQDDTEFRVGGLCTLCKQRGFDVRILAVCNGCGGHHIMTPEETSRRRYKESQAVAALIGARYDVFSDIDDCSLVADLETRHRLIRYIREYSPDIIITHRPNDYHADHRAVAQLVQDASYMLTVPHDCPDTPAMRRMPVIMYANDRFTNPPFRPDLVIDIGSVIDTKYRMADINASQVYEWLPYTECSENDVPPATDPEARFNWLIGASITEDTTDAEIAEIGSGYGKRFALPAAKYREALIKRYGEERGARIRFAEAFEFSEYGAQLTDESKKELFPF